MLERKEIVFGSMDEYKASAMATQGVDRDRLDGGLKAWSEAGSPHLWVKVEEKQIGNVRFEVLVDLGYGGLRLMRNGIEVDTRKYEINTAGIPGCPEQVIVLDRDNYGVHKYIWERPCQP